MSQGSVSELVEQAKVHLERGEIAPAIEKLGIRLNQDFDDSLALFLLGFAHIQQGENGLGAVYTQQALRIKPHFPEALTNLGMAHRNEHHRDTALGYWRLALEQEDIPNERAKIMANIGGLHVVNGTPDKAVEWYDRALKEAPGVPQVEFNRGLAYLEQGRWQEGWRGFHTGFRDGARSTRTYRNIPEWDGSPGKTVIVWGEQGIGDEIMFASCIPDLMAISKKVIFDCHPRLVRTFERSFPGVEVHGTRKTLVGIDWVEQCGADASICVATLPMWFRKRDQEFPGTPFLKAESRAMEPKRDTRPRIGISWAGGAKQTRADLRSIPLRAFEPILRAVDANWYSLQYTPEAAGDVCLLEQETMFHVKHYPDWVQHTDYDRTMSFIASLDLVISVCTTAVHAAGSLGVPCWVLVPSKPAWRYARPIMPWYASVELWRQRPGEEWERVIARVAGELGRRFHQTQAQNIA